MGLFGFKKDGFKKENGVLDLTSSKTLSGKKEQENSVQDYIPLSKEDSSKEVVPVPFGFFGNTPQESNPENNFDSSDQKKKLAKRLVDLTNRLEDVSNQIYHLQQRVEVLERKLDLNRF